MNKRFRSLMTRLLASAPPRLQCRIQSWRSKGRVAMGRKAYIHPSVQILGKAQVALGDNSVLSQDCWLNVNHRDRPGRAIEIGSNCFIGRRNFFSSGASIVVSDYVLTANDCQFLGASHATADPMRPVLGTGTSGHDSIVIGANSFLGAGVRVIGSVRIGHGCVIGAGSLVTRDIPPFSQAHGSPAAVRRRFSIARQLWVPVEEFTPEDASRLPAQDSYTTQLAQAGAIHMPYIATGNDMGDL